MTRNKKRILKKKQVKKQIKKKPVTNNKPTSDQQSRQNEMLKVMLSKQPQIIPGQTQTNDKMQEKLDAMNKAYSIKMQELQNQRRVNESADETTTLKTSILRAEDEIRKLKDTKAINEAEFSKDKLRVALERAKEEKETLTAAIAAQEAAMKDESYINPKPALIEAQKDLMLKEAELQQQKKIAAIKQNTLRNLEEQEAYKRYMEELTRGERIPRKNLNGTIKHKSNGEIWYETEDDGKTFKYEPGTSMIDKHAKQEAEVTQKLEDSKIGLDLQRAKIDEFNKTRTQITRKEIELENMERERKRLDNYYNSKEYTDSVLASQRRQKELEAKERMLESQKHQTEVQKRITELETRERLAREYDPLQKDYTEMKEELNHIFDNISKRENDAIESIQASRQLDELHLQLHGKINQIAERYRGQDQIAARNNLYGLIKHKTGERLTEDVDSYDEFNTRKAIEFIEKLGTLNEELLITPDQITEFVEGPVFTEFDWKI